MLPENKREENRIRSAKWAAANRETARARARDWYEANRDAVLARRRASKVSEDQNAERRKHYAKNRDEINRKRSLNAAESTRRAAVERVAEWRKRNEERYREYLRDNYQKTAEDRKAATRKYAKDNPHKVRRYSSVAREKRALRVPKWLSAADWLAIDQTYDLAVRMSGETGIAHHVDHIIPLCGKHVSGLHVPGNLQVITASENMRKHNRYQEVA